MASLNQVSIELQVKGEQQATQGLNRFAESGKRVGTSLGNMARKVASIENEVRSFVNMQQRGVVTSDQLSGAYGKLVAQLRTLTGMTGDQARAALEAVRASQEQANAEKEAARAAREAAAASKEKALADQKAARDAEELARETQQLAMAYNPVMAAATSYEQKIEQLNRAEQLGVLTKDQLQSELAQLSAAYEAIGTDVNKAAAFVRNFNVANTHNSRALNGTGMAMQQVGYQVGDFLVQVQSGTNAFVAFGQQATQMVGILPMMGAGFMGLSGTALVALSASLGIIIPLVTAVGAGLMRARQEAEDANNSFEGLGETLNRLESIRLEAIGESLAAGARAAMQEWQPVLDLLERVELRELQSSLDQEFDAIVDQLASFQNRIQVAARLGEDAPEFDLFGLDQFEKGIELARVLQSIQGETREELQEQLRLAEERLRSQEMLTPEVEQVLSSLAEELGVVEAINSQVDETNQNLQDQLELSRQITEQENQRNQAHVERIQDIQNEIRVMQLTLQYGEESVQVQTELNRQARARVVTEMMAAGHTAESIAAYIALVREAQELADAIAEAETTADGTADAVNQINFANAIAGAESLARSLGVSLSTARLIAGMGGAGVGEEALDPRSPRFNPAAAEQARRDAELAAIRESFETSGRGTGGGGGGGGAAGFESLIPGMEALAEAVRAANEQAQMFEQNIGILDDALQHGLITQQQYNEMVGQLEEAYGQATQAGFDYQSAMEQIAETAKTAMGDAFMSIVDGSATAADAFKNMARRILAQAFELLVVQPIMDSLFGGGGKGGGGNFLRGILGFENGGAFHGGRVIPFADGGIVSSPTMFPMRGGSNGLMGEAGPEAIMPLKRTRGGKLGVAAEGGGEQPIHLTQVFQINGNGDEYILGKIKQAAPQIAAMASEKVVDSRRRGGAMKQAFGG